MRRFNLGHTLPIAALILGAANLPAQTAPSGAWRVVDSTLGRTGTPMPGGVMRYALPRYDLDLAVADVHVLPSLAQGGWIAFLPTGDSALVLGDLVLVLEEIAPVVLRLQRGGIEITAEHNHLVGEEPRLTYVHIMGRGTPAALAAAIQHALELSGTPRSMPAPLAGLAYPLDTAGLSKAAGVAGKISGGVWQMSVPRAGPISMMGTTLPPAMGLASAINVQPIDASTAATTGDFVLTVAEVPRVVQALTDHGFTVTAVHSHLKESTPPLLFVHFWAVSTDARIIEGIAAAVQATRAPATTTKTN